MEAGNVSIDINTFYFYFPREGKTKRKTCKMSLNKGDNKTDFSI